MKKFLRLFLLLFLLSSVLFAQKKDSIKTYKLDEITVKSGIIIEPKTVTEIDYAKIKKADASNLIELGRVIPSIKSQTNSRGETLFYLRGSGERQIALFFEGVPLNIPWDNRIDLSLIPTEAIGEITVTRGIPSVVYGANAIAGVINVNTVNAQSGNQKGLISTKFGGNDFHSYSGLISGGEKKLFYAASASYKNSSGFNLPESYNQPESGSSKERINSFLRSYSLFSKINYKFDDFSDVNLSLSLIDSEKGVPPESNVGKPRFWRYPEWRKSTVNINGKQNLAGRNSILVYSFAASKFNMQIDQYTDQSFTEIDDTEKDEDLIFNGRLIYSKIFNKSSLVRFALNGLSTIHDEQFLSGDYQIERYSQYIYSAGAEYEFIENNFTAIAGLSLDGSATPKTGDKPSKDPISDVGINTAFIYAPVKNYSIQLNFGRKTRFPTLRETFSGALGRFVPNPKLKSEVAYTGELNFTRKFDKGKSDLNFFFSYVNGGIVRIALPDRQFQRVNKDKIRTYGVEFISEFEILQNLKTNFNFTYLNSFSQNDDGDFTDTLEYKPQFIAGLFLGYKIKNLLPSIEVNYTGVEFAYQEGNEYLQKLPDHFLLNARLAYNLPIDSNKNLAFFIRANNIFDKLYYSQWGLPEAGRQFFAGLNFEF